MHPPIFLTWSSPKNNREEYESVLTCTVNKAVIPDKYPLPTAEELIAYFYGSTVFSKLDLRQGYLQVTLHPSSRDLTAFVAHAGVFRYTRMPFGLSLAPVAFKR